MTRDARRASLLRAAARVVAGQSSARLTFDAIAAEAGVSATLPYKYFESPEAVALELYRQSVAAVDRRTDELLADVSRPFDLKVRETFLLWCDLVERDNFLFVRLAEGANAAALDRAVRARRERTIDVWATQLGNEFHLDAVTARIVAASVTAGAGAVVQRVFTDRLDRHNVADVLVRVVRAQCEAAR